MEKKNDDDNDVLQKHVNLQETDVDLQKNGVDLQKNDFDIQKKDVDVQRKYGIDKVMDNSSVKKQAKKRKRIPKVNFKCYCIL